MRSRSVAGRVARVARVGAAWVTLAAYWLLLRLSPSHVVQAAPNAGSMDEHPVEHMDALLRDVVSAVDRAAELHPLRPACLERALTCRRLLLIHGHQARVAVGVARRDATLDAHAWVEVGSHANDAARAEFITLTYLR